MKTTDSRAAFEATILGLYPVATFGRFASGRYNIDWIENQWGGWQLALNHATTEAAKATGTAGKLPSLPEGKAWASPLRYGSKIGFPKPVKPANWDDDDGVDWFCHPYFTADQMHEYGQQCAEAARYDADAAKRLRLICKLLGIESHVPADDETLWGAAFAVLGQVRAALEAARQPAPIVAIKSWPDRMYSGIKTLSPTSAMQDEIAGLRKALETKASVVLSDTVIIDLCAKDFPEMFHHTDDQWLINFARAILAATNRSQP